MSHNKIRLSTLSLTKIKRAPHKMEGAGMSIFGPDLERESFKRRFSALHFSFPLAGESGGVW